MRGASEAAALDSAASYYRVNGAPAALRLALGASERLWPSFAARAALRLFSTPLPLKWLRRRHDWPDPWRIARWPFEQASLTLYEAAPSAPERPVVLLVHGWGGHARQMLPLAQALLQVGLHPVLLEMPAHGASAGSTSNLPQFARAIEYVAGRVAESGRPLRAVLGHSLGANAAAFAAGRGVAAERLVLLAPPASPQQYTRVFARAFGLSEATRRTMQARIEAREAVLMRHFEPAAVGPRVGQRVLVVHDRDDRINPFSDGEAFAGAIGRAELLETRNLGHRKLLADARVIARVSHFLLGV